MSKQGTLSKIMGLVPVIPVVVIERLEDAQPIANALVQGGLNVIEVTLRSECAIEAISQMAANVPGAIVGAGTLTNANQIRQVEDAGGEFMVSPGTSPKFLDAALSSKLPLLPGVGSCSEAMAMGELGLHNLKFFPAQAAGGVPFLKSLNGPLPQYTFCPTGGISLSNAMDYLKLPNVACVGGSWVVPGDLVKARDWEAIKDLAREAKELEKV